MAKVANITPEESIKQNLDGWCLEVGSVFEQYSIRSANKFIGWIGKGDVADLGCGDGAATNVFVANGNKTTAVDINKQKLDKVKGAIKVQDDFLGFLAKPITQNVFLHHSLEHFVNYKDVLSALTRSMKKGSLLFIAVPINDEVHSVHHVAFENHTEITPKGFTVIENWVGQDPSWPEIGIIARKI